MKANIGLAKQPTISIFVIFSIFRACKGTPVLKVKWVRQALLEHPESR